MKKIALLLLLIFPLFSYAGVSVIGGENAEENEFPWLAQIRLASSMNWNANHVCGGTLVAPRVVMTAAHCITGPASTYRVVLGEHRRSTSSGNEDTYSVSALQRHPQYNAATGAYDIGVIILSRNAALIPGVVETAQIGRGPGLAGGDLLSLVGWGRTSIHSNAASDILQKGNISTLSWDDCTTLRNQYGRGRQTFCAGSNSGTPRACHGDSGSPVMIPNTNTVQGLVSGGNPNCAENFSFFTDLGNTWYWVQSWVDYYSLSHAASLTCDSAGQNATRCYYQGNYFRGMEFTWGSNNWSYTVVYPSYGSFPVTNTNSMIIISHPNHTQCQSGTRMSLTTRFYGRQLGSAAFTCP